MSAKVTKKAALTRKADELLRRGDALMVSGKAAEGKRLLRKCRRLRLQARIKP
jgi:hypothetical protein